MEDQETSKGGGDQVVFWAEHCPTLLYDHHPPINKVPTPHKQNPAEPHLLGSRAEQREQRWKADFHRRSLSTMPPSHRPSLLPLPSSFISLD